VPYITWHIDSFVNPNARCPVCGASVFYYCNENGSSVFFDELGPPWPKHPCTDNPNKYAPLILDNPARKVGGNDYQWVRDRWELYRVVSAFNVDNSAFKLVLEKDGTEIAVFVSKADLSFYKYVDIFKERAAVFLNGSLRTNNLSTLTPLAKPFSVRAYRSLLDVPRSGIKMRRKK
jgi:hypothetical protein